MEIVGEGGAGDATADYETVVESVGIGFVGVIVVNR